MTSRALVLAFTFLQVHCDILQLFQAADLLSRVTADLQAEQGVVHEVLRDRVRGSVMESAGIRHRPGTLTSVVMLGPHLREQLTSRKRPPNLSGWEK